MNEAQLRADVCQSQAIEHIACDEESQLFDLHLKATKYVYETASAGEWPRVRDAHRTLMATSIDMSGWFRTVPVTIGKLDGTGEQTTTPSPLWVDLLMEAWEETCRLIIESKDNPQVREYAEQLCHNQYYHFLCIHPFEDGNGRTGRLMYNALRLNLGLPWHTLTVDVHPLYVSKLREYEKDFKEEHRSYYPGA